MDLFKRYMIGAKPVEKIAVANKTGWHLYRGEQRFVNSNDRKIKDDALDQVILADGIKSITNIRGSVVEWNNRVGIIAREHRLLLFGMCVALSGPFLHILGMSSFLAHIFGQSTIGKTTLAKVAYSIWGNWHEGGRDLPTWNTTLAALEVQLRSSNDMFMVLDELSLGSPQVVDDAAYMISGGGGKSRSQSKGGLRDTETWRVPVLSTGELSISETIRKARSRFSRDGSSENAGQGVRALDIPVKAIFDQRDTDGAAIAKELSEATKQVHGVVGQELVQRLMTLDPELVRAQIKEHSAKFIGGRKWNSEVSRVADVFATIAAVGAITFNMLADWASDARWNSATALSATEHVMEMWIGEGSEDDRNVPHTKRKFLEAIRDDIIANLGSKYQTASEADMNRPVMVKDENGLDFAVLPLPVSGGETYGYRMKNGDVVISPGHFKGICRLVNIDKMDGIKYLEEANILVKGPGRNSENSAESQTWIPRLGRSVYWIRVSADIFGDKYVQVPESNVVRLRSSGDKEDPPF